MNKERTHDGLEILATNAKTGLSIALDYEFFDHSGVRARRARPQAEARKRRLYHVRAGREQLATHVIHRDALAHLRGKAVVTYSYFDKGFCVWRGRESKLFLMSDYGTMGAARAAAEASANGGNA
jgi:hypothetical protein